MTTPLPLDRIPRRLRGTVRIPAGGNFGISLTRDSTGFPSFCVIAKSMTVSIQPPWARADLLGQLDGDAASNDGRDAGRQDQLRPRRPSPEGSAARA
jgi:hypothetical protein